ncbi:hypothetical protein AAG570_003963 [Ranatra chinensis]|uniref:ABC-type xenobiotic transporter n=1 Tax=Ranatra chinensis TaxID=642074 RepID=A0ABD0YF04_9HEMI
MTCLRVPFLALLALVSAYYSGLWPGEIRRAKRDVNILRGRCVISLCLSALPVIQTYTEVWKFPGSLYQVEYLTVAVECFGWLVHLAYVSVLCRGGACRNLRGPVLVGMVWTGVALLSCFTLHSDYLRLGSAEPLIASNLPIIFSSVRVGLLGIYLVTLIPSEHSLQSYQLLVNSGEQSPSFGVYSRFREDLEPDYLGFPMHGWSKFSRLFFCWVNPLMEKGSVGKLQNQEELYDLPDSLSSTYLYLKLNSALTPKHILVTPSMKVSLLKALHLCFWKEFYGIGFLKLFSDISGFFGPLFLHSLVQFIESKEEPIENGCLYALGLSGVSLIGALCIPHFNFLMTIVGLKIRGALITAVYRKTLSLNSKSLSKFSTGEIVNFMSTDMDRIVNSCASFHAFWSIPFQIVVTLYLLYQQVGVSFLAGVGFSILLIPINKCIASKIGQLSTKMMNFKDQRIMLISEILRGIRAIKLYVWEEVFMKKVSSKYCCHIL